MSEDRETHDAIATLAHRISVAAAEGEDPAYTAHRFITDLRARGWRRVIEPPPKPGTPAAGPPAGDLAGVRERLSVLIAKRRAERSGRSPPAA